MTSMGQNEHAVSPSGASSEVNTDASAANMFRVAVFGHVNDSQDIAELLAHTLGLNTVDARIHTRHIPGLLPDRLDEWRAAGLVEVLFEHGLSAAAFNEHDIPSLDHPQVVHHAACHENGLQVYGLVGVESGLVCWGNLELISVGEIPQEPPHHSSTGHMVVVTSAPHTENEHVESKGIHGPELWLIARRPERVFRIDHRQMNYEYLGSRKTGSATVNFRLLLEDIVAHAAQAWLTPATHAWLKHESQFKFAFHSSEDLCNTTLTHLLMHREFERQGSATSSSTNCRPPAN